ncbi:tetratricopeptide repeat protein [Tumebacillus permanentifrigoris]|uniref:HTH cro/C1-type domain-containing protein n=1 Tax=Tumebacillus permanentifrigoris TaxID=378543 RepID=A0A316D830_9BACL|nr:helix-turn-helix transcriptional regulator [Tumebacillus permanentifrigoris]PWK12826.1 hypothetical protein C7459_109188 [Tumebacillus permanentifrigoris]
MNSLVAPSFTAVDKIPLGRRIEEIKKEKGGYYSNVAMAGRIGTNHETLRLMWKGKREIYTFELDKIAIDLKLPVERILQVDVKKETEELIALLLERKHPDKTLKLALKLADQALGLSERCNAMLRLGQAFNDSYQFIESKNALEQAHQLALRTKEHYGETDILYSVMYQLMASYTAIRDFKSASDLLNEIMPFFEETPSRLSSISYQKAMIEESNGNIVAAHKFAVESVQHAKESGNQVLLAQTKFNLAHFEFKMANYSKSQVLLTDAIKEFDQDSRSRIITRKEIVKTLLKQGLKSSAVTVLETAIVEARDMNWRDMLGKLLILYTLATDQPSYAKAILDDNGYSLKIRYLACKCLLEHYRLSGDAPMFLHYHEVAEKMCIDFSDFLDEGEL